MPEDMTAPMVNPLESNKESKRKVKTPKLECIEIGFDKHQWFLTLYAEKEMRCAYCDISMGQDTFYCKAEDVILCRFCDGKFAYYCTTKAQFLTQGRITTHEHFGVTINKELLEK